MPHIHELIDYAVGAFIVKKHKVALIHHRALGIWICAGGHIELDEDPEQAVLRETFEETGLEIELVGERCPVFGDDCKPLIRPRWMDIHKISDTHRHVGIFYDALWRSGELKLAEREHFGIDWFDLRSLESINTTPTIRHYAMTAILELGPRS